MPQAFTTYHSGIVPRIINECMVSIPMPPKEYKFEEDELVKVKALWDTGATGSVILSETVKKLNLKPISKCEVQHAGGTDTQNVYLIHIFLPNHVILPYVRVTESPQTTGDFGAIIGMNIINLGDFAISNFGKKTVCSFRIPSIEKIDFVEQINKASKSKSSKKKNKKR